jgi:hypothetical protein
MYSTAPAAKPVVVVKWIVTAVGALAVVKAAVVVVENALPAGPCGPCGPAGPVGPGGPCGPTIPPALPIAVLKSSRIKLSLVAVIPLAESVKAILV